MYTNNEYNTMNELEGKFKVDNKYFCCCHKMVDIWMVLTNDKLIFYKDKNKTKIYRTIERDLILAINRRLRIEKDKNKLSIYYFEHKGSHIIKELKLKAESRYDMEKWISVLNKKIKPKRIEFDSLSQNYINSNDIFNFKNESKFYVALCNLEYILLKNKMENFFEIYRNNNLIYYEKSDNNNINETNENFEEKELINENI